VLGDIEATIAAMDIEVTAVAERPVGVLIVIQALIFESADKTVTA
jgi:hypothetical protein